MSLIISTMLLILTNQYSIETPNYKLVKKYKNFEIRDYEKMIVAHTKIKRTFRESTSTGFRRIANYIFGGNDKSMEIAMTAPVLTKFPSDINSNIFEVSFVMPKEHNLKSLPSPDLETVSISERQLGRVAVFKFGGWATENRTKYYIDQLINSLKKERIDALGDIMVAQYNSPWVMPPFRKNEIIIAIK